MVSLTKKYGAVVLASLFLFGCAAEDSDITPPGLIPGGVIQNPEIGEPEQPLEEDSAEPEESSKELPDQNSDVYDSPGRKPVEVVRESAIPVEFPLIITGLGEQAKVFDVGQRSDSSWFLVLNFTDVEAANQYVSSFSAENNLLIDSSDISEDGSEWLMSGEGTIVEAFVMYEDGQALLNVEIELG